MDRTVEIEQMLRQFRWLKVYCIAVTGALAVMMLGGATARQRFDEIDVERINVVDSSGVARLVISNADRFPPPVVGGKTYKRAVNPAGIVFFDERGDEVGGLALSNPEHGRVSALAFDYSDSDAMGLVTRISPDSSNATAGLVINSRPDKTLKGPAAMKAANNRVALQNRDETAELVLSDPQGRARLKMFVGPDGEPHVEMLDAGGKVVRSMENEGR